MTAKERRLGLHVADPVRDIRDNTWIGEGTWILNTVDFARTSAPIRIEDGAGIALLATTLNGATVGARSTVGLPSYTAACPGLDRDCGSGSQVYRHGQKGSDMSMAGPDLNNNRLAFSILVPSYNAGKYLEAALESALSQLSDDDEILVQDAQSTDGSAEYLTKLGEVEPRVMTAIEKDDGQSDALNRALARATNPWVIWLNADDILLESSLAALRDAVRCNPEVDVVIGGHQHIRADGSLVDTYQGEAFDISKMVKWGCAAFSGSIMMRTEFLNKIGGFEIELNTVMDLALQLRMAEAQPRQMVIATPIGALRFHEASKTANLWPQFVRESHSVRMRYAVGGKQRLSGYIGTALHWAIWPILRIRLTSNYRRLRRRLLRPAARWRRGRSAPQRQAGLHDRPTHPR